MTRPNISEVIPYAGVVCSVYVAGKRAASPAEFADLRGTRDLVRIAAHYRAGGVDRMFLDVQDSWEQRADIEESVGAMAAVGPPLWVSMGNGVIRDLEEVRGLLDAGAGAVTVNTTAVDDPGFVRQAVAEFGSARVVGVVNASARSGGGWEVCVDGGERRTGIDLVSWCRDLADIGLGALIVNDLDRDYAGRGYNLPLIRAVADVSPIPVIACGGSGRPEHLPPALTEGGAHAVFIYSMIYTGRYALDEAAAAVRPYRQG
ncbi:HisA/HisF-related TIM barrel protein [Streptomyces vinaceus]